MSLAEYEDRAALIAISGELRPVWISGQRDGRLVTADLDGAESVVALARLFWIGGCEVRSPQALASYWREVSARAERCDLRAAWDATQDQEGPVDAALVAAAGLGSAGELDRDALVVAVFACPVRFRVKKRVLTRVSGEALERARIARESSERGKRIEALSRAELGARLAGQAPSTDPEVLEAVAAAIDVLVDAAVFGEESTHKKAAAALLKALDQPTGTAFELLVALGVFEPDDNLAIRRAGIPVDFSDALIAEAAQRASTDVVARTDLTHLTTVAIDDAATTEVDDAFAIEGDRLYVFIADVASFVPPGSPLDIEARRRASTVYLPERSIPMLPQAVGSGAASLVAGAPRTALCFSFELGPEGGPVAFEVSHVRIQVDRQLTYDEADDLLAGPADASPVARLLHTARGWMVRHRQNRQRRGAVFFQRNEVYLSVDADRVVRARGGNPHAPGRVLISEMMIATCAGAAQFCAERAIPCIYRSQAAPDEAVVTRDGRVDNIVEQQALLRRLKPAVLGTSAGGHFTLGVGAYTQLSSPIRRYHDLLMHQQLRAWLRTGRERFSNGQLNERLADSERTISAIKRAEWESRRFWGLRYLEQHPGEVFRARVVRQLPRRWLVELDALALQFPVRLGRGARLGQEVLVRVAKVDARADRLLLEEHQPSVERCH